MKPRTEGPAGDGVPPTEPTRAKSDLDARLAALNRYADQLPADATKEQIVSAIRWGQSSLRSL